MCGYNHKADIWSLACCAYELLTGEPLFDPEKDSKYSTDFHHIFWIMELLGNIPKRVISKSRNSKEFFYSSGKFKGKIPLLHPLSIVLEKDVEIECSKNIIYLLEKMLLIDPQTRFDYDDIIKYINENY
jgi:serine/threonine protein kinase